MSGYLYIISGAAGSGKSTLLMSLCPKDNNFLHPELNTIRAPKYSEREQRPEKDGVVDDIIPVKHISTKDYDICYVINDKKYGIRIAEIRALIDQGLNPVVILSDFRVVRSMKAILGDQVRTIYLSSTIDADRLRRIQLKRYGFNPSEKEKGILSYHFERLLAASWLGWWNNVSDCIVDLEADWRAYTPDAKSTEVRVQKLRAFHIRYIDQLQLYNHVILNYTESKPEEMFEQAKNIILNSGCYLSHRIKSFPPIFVVAAASASGKGTLLAMLKQILTDRVRVTSKLAKREFSKEDKDDGMIALWRKEGDPEIMWPDWWIDEMIEIGKRGEFPSEYDMEWEFHKDRPTTIEVESLNARPEAELSREGTFYAVSPAEIQRNVDDGVPQIFVSNMEQFAEFRSRWPENVVFIYLHRLSSEHMDREYQKKKWPDNPREVEKRLREKRFVYSDYIQHIAEFDHVLLNTSFEEDFYDQMIQLIEFYYSAEPQRTA